MAAEDSPVKKIFDALWVLLEAWTGFTDIVPVGNRVKYTAGVPGTLQIKQEVADADLPEVRIVPTGMITHYSMDSAHDGLWAEFQIEVATGDTRIDAVLFPLQWEIYRALAGASAALNALEWNGKAGFALSLVADVISEGVSDTDLSRGIKGWSAVWSCRVHMAFTHTDLITP